MRELFGADTAVQFRPHYFPFTEPSLEVYVKSKALKKGEQWIEVAGSGIVHPAVFEAVNKARATKLTIRKNGQATHSVSAWIGSP